MRLLLPWYVLATTLLCIGLGCAQKPADAHSEIRITEFMAKGTNTTSPSGEWVEFHNRANEPRDLTGWRLVHQGREHVLPAHRLSSGAYTVIQPGFRLRGRGGSITLLSPEGEEVVSKISDFPKQYVGVSYGISASGKRAFFDEPTPGFANGEGFLGVCQDVVFSRPRGFYERPFRVELTSSDPKASIRYTLDGSMPSARQGEAYSNEIQIGRNTTLRAVALRPGHLPGRVVTNTYLFLDQVIAQPKRPGGFPNQWGRNKRGQPIPGDYEMDPRVTEHTLPGFGMREALLDLPTISVVLPADDLFDGRRGIYSHSEEHGVAWERATSMEWIDPKGGEGFQVNAGIRMQGNSSRRPERMQKHSFRLDFQSQYGVKKLEFPIFPGSPVKTFNKLVLRTPSTDSWALTGWVKERYRPNDSQYIRDVWMKESLRAMGHPSGRSRFVHLYLNGLYWGIYILAERLDEDFFASHLGGQPEEWDIIRDFVELMAGNTSSWYRMNTQVQSTYDPKIYQTFLGESSSLNLRNFADYMLLHFLADAEDWPHHNYYAAARRGHPFRFIAWDQEIILDNHAMNRMRITEPGPGRIFHGLMRQPAFRYLFADRVHFHTSPGGALSLSACQKRYRDLSRIIDKAIVAESARWGDTADRTSYGHPVPMPGNAFDHNDPFYPAPADRDSPYMTRESSWVVERDNVLENYLPSIFDPEQEFSFVNKLRDNRLYPRIDPPVIESDAAADGIFEGSVEIRLGKAASEGDIIYTLDGTDPRTPQKQGEFVSLVPELSKKRAIVPTDDSLDRTKVTWSDPGFDDSEWPLGSRGAGYERSGEGTYRPFIDPKLDMARKVSPLVNESIYLRAPFIVKDPKALARLTLGMRYDDGYIAYINGREVARANAATPRPRWNMPASARRRDRDATVFETVDIKAALPLLRKGKNVLAVQALNDDPGSSDFLVHPILEGAKRIERGTGESKGSRYENPITLTKAATIKAAVRNEGEWSALATQSFAMVTPAAAGNVLVSEIMYHPENEADAEFVEIRNVESANAISLSGVRLEGAIECTLSEDEPLAPGNCMVVVNDLKVFRKKVWESPKIAGIYLKSLSNSKDTIRVVAADGQVIESVTYRDDPPWPLEADGQGPSLERRLNDREATEAPSVGASWMASPYDGGSPGVGAFYK